MYLSRSKQAVLDDCFALSKSIQLQSYKARTDDDHGDECGFGPNKSPTDDTSAQMKDLAKELALIPEIYTIINSLLS
jgi:hypothetical protein